MKEITIHQKQSELKPKTCLEAAGGTSNTTTIDEDKDDSIINNSKGTLLSDRCKVDSSQESNREITQSTKNTA